MKKERINKHDDGDKKVKRLYHQRYRAEWEKIPEFAHWLNSSNDGYSAYCKICDGNVLARMASIKQHHVTRKHQEAMKCNDFLSKNVIKQDTDTKDTKTSASTSKVKAKPKPKRFAKMKREVKVTPMEEDDLASNDSILEDLLGNEALEQDFIENEDQMEETDDNEPSPEQEAYEEEIMHLKQDQDIHDDLNEDALSEDQMISEFDLFGKSVALQLNNMELEDALLCQERLQVVLTEFRLKILKRKREYKRSS